MWRTLVFFIFAISINSCTTKPKSPPTFIQCPEQRAQMCTREFMPVCATRDTGVRCVTAPCPSSEQKTYGNACTACADEKVIGYIANACEKDTEK